MQVEDKLFYHIARSHLYWGRKPTAGLTNIFEIINLGSKSVFLDPFCGGGTSVICALRQGAKVLASDINPMAIFMTKVLIQPVSLLALQDAFKLVRDKVSKEILETYTISCPSCHRQTYFDTLKWTSHDNEDVPEATKISCNYCRSSTLIKLTPDETTRQLELARIQPKHWFPLNSIRSKRKTKVEFFHELFTGRNLSALASLHNSIENTSSQRCKEVLNYVFTSMLYSCSMMQMFSKESPSSSRGWTAPRFYLPPARQERNVWQVFENRFKNLLRCKEKLNEIIGCTNISNSLKEFEDSEDSVYLSIADFLEFPFPTKLQVTDVFLDPPYNEDIDYLGFSEFWGSWLGMELDISVGWHPGSASPQENAERFRKLLLRIRENTDNFCNVILAFGAKKEEAWNWMRDVVAQVGYDIRLLKPILYNNSQKRAEERGDFSAVGQYFLLKKNHSKLQENGFPVGEDSTELILYIRAAAFLEGSDNAELIRNRASNLVRAQLHTSLLKCKKTQIETWTSLAELNRKAYHRLCLEFVNAILSQDNFEVISLDASQFDDSVINGYGGVITKTSKPQDCAEGSDFVFGDDNGNGGNLIFCFYDQQKNELHKSISKKVMEHDQYQFRKICFLIVPSHREMIDCRQVERSKYWQRGFFVCFEELANKASEIDSNRFGQLRETGIDLKTRNKVNIFEAEVLKNIPVGGNGSSLPKHFKIKFRANELKYIAPGQFVMIDTHPDSKKRDVNKIRVIKSISELENRANAKILETEPVSFLKRPFSIHRGFYEYFEEEYIKNISLPHAFATIAHTVFPNTFDIFYKIVDGGVGTKELKYLKEGDTIQMIGPLGRKTVLAKLRTEGIEEVHLIGGGVGMAPLVYFGQGLRYYAFKIKAFIGIDTLETLLYKEPLATSLADEKAIVYIDDLLNIGLEPNDIYVSQEVDSSTNGLKGKLSASNCFAGFVSKQYEEYLSNLTRAENVLIIACGPQPMLRALSNIADRYNIKMKVLLEKRMGCGIGVCMSCACLTKKNNVMQYARVCIDGPLFDVKDIVWE